MVCDMKRACDSRVQVDGKKVFFPVLERRDNES